MGAIALCSLAVPAAAQSDADSFTAAREAYIRSNYDEVVLLLQSIVAESNHSAGPILVQEARKYLGAAHVLLSLSASAAERAGHLEDANEQFRLFLRAEGDEFDRYQLDPGRFSGPVHQAFRAVQQELIDDREATEDLRRRAEAQHTEAFNLAMSRIRELAETSEVDVQHEPIVALVPFGAGQFQNRNEGLGYFFLISQAAFAVGGLSTLIAWTVLDSLHQPAGMPGVSPGAEHINNLIYANWTLNSAWGALTIIGIVEALVNFVPSHRETQEREIPPEIDEGLELVIGPGNIGISGSF